MMVDIRMSQQEAAWEFDEVLRIVYLYLPPEHSDDAGFCRDFIYDIIADFTSITSKRLGIDLDAAR